MSNARNCFTPESIFYYLKSDYVPHSLYTVRIRLGKTKQ
ncbi:MAG: hypothetical protein H6P94_286 [Thermoplasmatales archaeon]|nr:hypothetical protein [Thermoplasmatales archaeon]